MLSSIMRETFFDWPFRVNWLTALRSGLAAHEASSADVGQPRRTSGGRKQSQSTAGQSSLSPNARTFPALSVSTISWALPGNILERQRTRRRSRQPCPVVYAEAPSAPRHCTMTLEQTARVAWWRDCEPALFSNQTIRNFLLNYPAEAHPTVVKLVWLAAS